MTRPIRVLLLIDSLSPEAGTENQVIETIRRLDRSRVELFVACMEDGARLQALMPFATPLVYATAKGLSYRGLRELYRLQSDLRRLHIDVVHTFMVRATIFGVVGAVISRIPVIITSRRNMGYWYTPKLLQVFRLLNRFTTRVLANSQGARLSAIEAEGLPPERVDVIYNGVDLTRFDREPQGELRSALGIPESAPVVGIVANYRPVKNLPLFLKAAQIVLQQFPEAVFIMVGRGPLRAELEQLAAELGIARSVVFTDDRGDVFGLYPLFDIACLTSHSEGFSNAVLEYMGAGLPVVATEVGGVGEVVEHSRTGYLVPPGDAAGLASYITALLHNPQEREAMGRRGRERCEEFSWPLVARQLEEYYRRLVTSESAAER